MDDTSPAFLALRYAITSANMYRGRVGAHRCNLFNTIKADLLSRNISLETVLDLDNVRDLASDRARWRRMF